MPMTPLSGVRTSWLMRARNSLLARLAASAAFWAWTAASPRRSSVTSVRRLTTQPLGVTRLLTRITRSPRGCSRWPGRRWARRRSATHASADRPVSR